MNSNQMYRHLAYTFRRLLALSESKGVEYVGGEEEDRLRNFKDGGERVGVHPAKSLFIALDKHWNAISTYVKELGAPTRRVLSEPIAGRIDDAILYLNLMKMLLVDLGEEKDACPERDELSDYTRLPALFDEALAACRVRGAGSPGPAPDLRGFGSVFGRDGQWETGPGAPQFRATEKALNPDSIRSLTKMVTDWSTATFPKRSLDTIILKLTSHELPELVLALANRDWEKVDGEVGDVLILLLDLFAIRQAQLGLAVQAKMEVNRLRRWTIDNYGISRHVADKEGGHG